MKYSFWICLISIFCGGCYYDNKEDLYEYVEVEVEGSLCEFTDVSYSMELQELFNLNCNNACHNAVDQFGGVVLDSHASLLNYVTNGSLISVINHESGFSPMPPGAKLEDCDIEKIQFWVDNGAPNN